MTTNQRIELYTEAYKRWRRKQLDNMPEAFVGDMPRAADFGITAHIAIMCQKEIEKELSK